MRHARTAKSSLQCVAATLAVVLGAQIIGCGESTPPPAPAGTAPAPAAGGDGGKSLAGPKAGKEPITSATKK